MTAKLDGTNGLIQSYDYQTPTTGFNYLFTPSSTGTVLVMNPAGTLATGTITMPASPADGMTITFSSSQQITALTVNANTSQTINNAITTLAAGQSASYVYRAASTAWFPYTSVAATSVYAGPRAQYFSTAAAGQIFVIPTGVTSIKVTVVGGGGGGGGSVGGCTPGPGFSGGTGASGVQWLTGLTPGNTLTIAVGAAGSAGSAGNSGGSGGTSSVASGTQTITTLQCTGGGGGGSVGGSSGSSGSATGFVNGTLITGVAITGTAGQFSCSASSSTLIVGQRLTISGTLGGTGTITGYSNPTTYYIIATNGSTTFTLSATYGGAAITTTAGTPTGLTYTLNSSGSGSFAFNGYGQYALNKGMAGAGAASGGSSGGVGTAGAVLIEY